MNWSARSRVGRFLLGPSRETYVGDGLRVTVRQPRPLQMLHIEGSGEALGGFASYLVFRDETPFGSHFEYYPGHPVIAPESESLIISVG